MVTFATVTSRAPVLPLTHDLIVHKSHNQVSTMEFPNVTNGIGGSLTQGPPEYRSEAHVLAIQKVFSRPVAEV